MANDTTIQKSEAQAIQTERMRGGPTYVPAVDIVESPDEVLLVADMPGVQADSVDIQYERGQLTLLGKIEPREQPGNRLRREYGVGDFHRVFHVGEGIDANKIEAELADGVLTLHLPKSEALTPRKIAVKSN